MPGLQDPPTDRRLFFIGVNTDLPATGKVRWRRDNWLRKPSDGGDYEEIWQGYRGDAFVGAVVRYARHRQWVVYSKKGGDPVAHATHRCDAKLVIEKLEAGVEPPRASEAVSRRETKRHLSAR